MCMVKRAFFFHICQVTCIVKNKIKNNYDFFSLQKSVFFFIVVRIYRQYKSTCIAQIIGLTLKTEMFVQKNNKKGGWITTFLSLV